MSEAVTQSTSLREDVLSNQQTIYPHGALAFYDLLARWREQGDFQGLIVK